VHFITLTLGHQKIVLFFPSNLFSATVISMEAVEPWKLWS